MAAAKVLIATATGNLRIEIKKVLEKEFYKVVAEVSNSTALLRNCIVLKPDVVILDLFLEDGNAIEKINDIVSSNKDIKIIVISSSADKTTVYAAIKRGAKYFLPKPLDYNKLIDTIRKVLA